MLRVLAVVASVCLLGAVSVAQDGKQPILKAPPRIDTSGLSDTGALPALTVPPATAPNPTTSAPAATTTTATPASTLSSPDFGKYFTDLQQPKRVTELNYLYNRTTVEKKYPEYIDVVQGELTAIVKNIIGLPHYAYLRTIHFTWTTNQDKSIRLSFIDSATDKAFGHLDFDSAFKVKAFTPEKSNVDTAIANVANPYPKVEGNPEIMKVAALAKAVLREPPNYPNNKVRGEFEQLAKEIFAVASENKHLKLRSHFRKDKNEGLQSITIGFDFAEAQKELGIIGLHFSADGSKLRFINSRAGLVDPKVLIDEALNFINPKKQ